MKIIDKLDKCNIFANIKYYTFILLRDDSIDFLC